MIGRLSFAALALTAAFALVILSGVASAANVELASVTARFTSTAPTDEPTDEPCSGGGYDPTPTPVDVEVVPIVVESTVEEYFVLYVRHDMDGRVVEVPVSVTRGAAGTTTLAENVEALPKGRYRVKKFLVSDPADVDGDCIDDITELGDPVGMNPVNPAAAIDLSKGAVAIPDRATFDALSLWGTAIIKFTIFGADTDRPGVYFQNTNKYNSHFDFQPAVGIDPYTPGLISGYLDYVPEFFASDGSPGLYVYVLNYGQSFSTVDFTQTVLAASTPLLEDDLAYYMQDHYLPAYRHELAAYEASRINLVFDEDLTSKKRDFIPLNQAEGYGFLRIMDLEESPNPRDVVVYEALPNELPRVAGIITTVPQTPLSHVNLRAIQDGVPNAYMGGDTHRSYINNFVGKYVHYEVMEHTYSLRVATAAEVDAHFASSRPAKKQTPQRDLSVTEITALSGVGFEDWKAFGVKAANVAVLGTFGFPEGTVPDGFAIPFYFYDEFMKHNDFYTRIETMLADSEFQEDLEVQESKLKKLRKAIKKAETPGWIIDALTEMNELFPEGTNRRYRSSTNNEDLPGFNGAGLYDSKTQKPKEDEEDIAKSLKQVYASLWNFRAFTERDFYRIDHLAAAMGVLVHPNYSDELANGVAVSFNPLYSGKDSWYYVNTQIGEDLVTNPDALSVPEEILLDPATGEYYVVRTSNQKPPGQLLMTDDQLDQLRRHLAVIHEKFAKLYNPGSDEDFAMEIEFKITSDNVLAIKQARPWVFGPAPASDGAGTVTLSAVQPQVDTPLTATLTDPDGGVSGVAWSWHSSQDRTTWAVISGAAAASYTPVEADVGRYLRATASYTDEKGSGKSAEGVSDNAALAANSSPAFPSTETGNRTVSEDTAAGQNFGSPVAATDDDNDALTYFLGGTDAGFFHIVDTSGQLRTKAALDYESKSTYTVTVTATDPSGLADEITVTINVIDVEPSVAITLSPSGSVEPGNEIAVTMSFSGLESDSDTATKDYIFRADVKDSENGDADICEDQAGGYGLGVERYMLNVDEDPETRTGTVSADCPLGDYTIKASILSAANVELATASAGFSVVEPLSSDATLRGLALSGAPFAFDPAIEGYEVSVGHEVEQTTITVETNDEAASYEVALVLAASYEDGTVGLAVGANVIVLLVMAADGETTKTYTLTVTRAEAATPSTDAGLSGLTLSGVDIGTLDPAITEYTAGVGNDVTETTVTPTVNDDRATYAIKLGGVADSDGIIPLVVGSNVIAIEVTAEDGETAKTYTVTVTRAATPLSKDATLSGLALSGAPFAFDPAIESYEVSVGHEVEQTTITVETNDEAASYEVALVLAASYEDRTVGLAEGTNFIVLLVMAADGETTKSYTVTVARAEAATPSTDAVLSGLALSGITLAFDPDTTGYTASVSNDVDETTVTPATNDDWATYVIKLGGVADSDGVIPLVVGSNVIAIEVTAEDGETAKTYTVTVARAEPPADDATLSSLALSGIDIGNFDSATTEYAASVGNEVEQTTVTATANDGGATYTIKLDGVADADGTVSLSEGGNVITVEVTAEDGNTAKTYTATVTRAALPPAVAPDSPDAPTGSLDGAGNASLDWNDVETAAGYEVGLWWNGEWTTLPNDGAGLGVSISGSVATVTALPTHWTVYYFRVRAVNEAGTSDWSPMSKLEL